MIDQKTLYDKTYACWLGKNIGGTLGTPVEGKMEVMNLTWYPVIDPNGALPNDDLDLQLINLHAVEQYGVRLTCKDIAKEWAEHVFFPYDEYGYGLKAARYGFVPPFSGCFDNPFVNCMGSPIRSEIWACMCHGNPDAAAYFAWHDAVVDHANGEGLYGEVFNAALQALAFEDNNVERIIEKALTYLPQKSRVKGAVSKLLELYRQGVELLEAREIILAEYGNYNFTDAPQNIAFGLCGLLYGKDFEDAILKTVNLGYDTDCTVATCGATWGILYGRDSIPEKWVAPIGDSITVSAPVHGFKAPANLDELTNKTILMGKKLALEDVNLYMMNPEDAVDFLVQTFVLPENSQPEDGIVIKVRYENSPTASVSNPCKMHFDIFNNTKWDWDISTYVEGKGFASTKEENIYIAQGEHACYECSLVPNEKLKKFNRLELKVVRKKDGLLWQEFSVPFTVLTPNVWRVNGDRIEVEGMTVRYEGEGECVAETKILMPTERPTQVFVNTESPITVYIDGVEAFKTTDKTHYLPAYHRSPASQKCRMKLTAGEHDLKVVLKGQGTRFFTVGLTATNEVKEPGNCYAYTDVDLYID